MGHSFSNVLLNPIETMARLFLRGSCPFVEGILDGLKETLAIMEKSSVKWRFGYQNAINLER